MTRRSAREIIFKMLFAYESGENTPEESLSIAWEKPIEEKDKEYILRVLEGIIKNLGLIDGIIQKYTIDWKLERLLLTDKTLLRLAIYEILFFLFIFFLTYTFNKKILFQQKKLIKV